MIKVTVNKKQRVELEKIRHQASSKNSEKALMVLLNGDDGKTVSEISNILKRNPHTVRNWLKRYKEKGLSGLSRKFSPGRPNDKRKIVKNHIKKMLDDGLRATLETQSIVTGQLLVGLDFHKDAPLKLHGLEALNLGPDVLEIPTTKSGLQLLGKKIEQLPLDEIAAELPGLQVERAEVVQHDAHGSGEEAATTVVVALGQAPGTG